MQHRFKYLPLTAVVCLTALAATPAGAQAPQAAQQQPAVAPAKPYATVAISAPPAMTDASFEAFRKQVGEIAKRKDRTGLAKLIVAQGFFWLGEKGDQADTKKPGIDNLTKALDLSAKDGSGWETLAGYVADPTGTPLPDKKDVICAPAEPLFDAKAFEDIVKTTGTDESEWGYPVQPSVEVRSAAQPAAPVIEKLGMNFVRVMQDDGPAGASGDQQNAMLRVVTPAGKTGFVPADAVSPLGNDQLCYAKEAGGWKIAGFIGGE